MAFREMVAFFGLLLVSGCLYHAREHTDQTVSQLVARPFDLTPEQAGLGPAVPPPPPLQTKQKTPSADSAAENQASIQEQPATKEKAQLDIQTTAYMQSDLKIDQPGSGKKLEPRIPSAIPGAEVAPLTLPKDPEARRRAIEQLFPPLPPLPIEPTPQPGPDGRPYTLAELHELAAANSPEVRQAASDVEAARGNLIQARTYPNPTVSLLMNPANDASSTSEWGVSFDQKIVTAGKIKLASAAAEMDLRNAEVALRRARFDLATRVRSAYYALLVAKETARVTRGLSVFTEEIYRLQVGVLQANLVAAYEPMVLRAQAYSARLAYNQAIQSYIYAWKQLVAAMGLRQLPLSQVEGRIDAFIPYYDFDTVLDHVLRNHTDVLTARNGIDRARYALKLAQVTPIPDVEVNFAPQKEFVVAPKQTFNSAYLSIPFPIWDKNKGTIIAAESALVRATEEPHRVEMNLTNNLATAYQAYRINLQALDFYRNHILPYQVQAYRGVLTRRQLDPTVAFSDLFGAQQTLATFVTGYLSALGSLWTSAIGVADLLQTDDLFQLAERREVPPLPDLEHLPLWPCCHPAVAGCPTVPAPLVPMLPAAPAAGPGIVPQSAPAGRAMGPAASGSEGTSSGQTSQVEHADLAGPSDRQAGESLRDAR